MDLSLNFAQSGGVNAQSIGAEPPDCGPKAQAVIGPDGYWACVPVEDSTGLLGKNLVLVAAGVVLYLIYSKRWKGTLAELKRGNYGAIL